MPQTHSKRVALGAPSNLSEAAVLASYEVRRPHPGEARLRCTEEPLRKCYLLFSEQQGHFSKTQNLGRTWSTSLYWRLGDPPLTQTPFLFALGTFSPSGYPFTGPIDIFCVPGPARALQYEVCQVLPFKEYPKSQTDPTQ